MMHDDGFNPLGTGPDLEIKLRTAEVPRDEVRVISTRPCSASYCQGGQVELHADRQGRVDFLDGAPTGVHFACDYCGGTGEEPDEVEVLKAAEPEEGGACPEGCGGTLEFPPVENCSCHINPPCGACTDQRLTCNGCGWEEAKVEPEPVPSAVGDFYDKVMAEWKEHFERGHTFPHGGRVFEVRYDGSSGSTYVITGRYEGPVTPQDIIDLFGEGTFGHRGPTLQVGRFRYIKVTD